MKLNKLGLLTIILLVGTLTQVSTDIYLPSMPAIGHYFGVAIGQVQLTMTLLVLGVAISGLLYGSLADVIGRRNTLLIGLIITLVGNAICLSSDTIFQLQLGRFIQGCGLGACSALWRSIFRDAYSGDEMARVGSYLANIILISVILAPFLGGYIEHYGKWTYSFAFMVAWTVLVLSVIVFKFKETASSKNAHRFHIKAIAKNYGELLRCRTFMGYTLCSFLSYGGLFAWLTAGPVILISKAGISPLLFGWLSIITGAAMALGGTVNGKLVKKVGSETMMKTGWLLMSLSGVMMLGFSLLWSVNAIIVLAPALLFIFGSTLTFANAFAKAFEGIGHIAGFGGGLYSCIQLLGGVFFSGMLSHLSTSSQRPLSLMFIASGACAWLVYRLIAKKPAAPQTA